MNNKILLARQTFINPDIFLYNRCCFVNRICTASKLAGFEIQYTRGQSSNKRTLQQKLTGKLNPTRE